MRLGGTPRRYDVAFSTDRMSRLLEYEPADLTCRVEAGMLLRDLQEALLAQGQRLPLEPPHPDRATVGGMLAANTCGSRALRHGYPRDHVENLRVVLDTGEGIVAARQVSGSKWGRLRAKLL